ncbi:MAG: hypothetical protein JNL79_22720 [Myxococcales bacterium]|nr:hypothetical protein [Myxococcales bacterium]
MCPHCRQNAPIVYRGVLAYCTACGAPRPPFSAKSIDLAGQPSKIGGAVARVFGWAALIGGLLLSGTVIAVFQALWPAGFLGWALGVPIGLLALIVGGLSLFGGGKLSKSGALAQRDARFEAVYAMAATRQGVVTAVDVGRTLKMSTDEADRVLTEMTKVYPDYVSLEVDDHGGLFYKLAGIGAHKDKFGVKYRVAADGFVRVEDELAEGRAIQEQAEAEQAAAEQAKRGARQ